VVLALMALTGTLHVLGVGGLRAGWLWVGTPLVLGSAAVVYKVTSRAPRQGLWVAAAALCGLAATGALTSSAPLSKGALAQRMDVLSLPFFEQVSERREGNSWCRPGCPGVERRYLPPDVSNPDLPVQTVLLALRAQGSIDDEEFARLASRQVFVVDGEDLAAAVTLAPDASGRWIMTIRFSAHRR